MKNLFQNLACFPNLTEEVLLKRIRLFRRMNIKDVSDEELFMALNGLFRGDGSTYYGFPFFSGSFPVGQKFFRVRSISDNGHNVSLKDISSVSDAWEPPASIIRTYGRLNQIGIPALYTCAGDPVLAFQEAQAQNSKHFCLFVYEAKKEVKYATIGQDNDISNYSQTDRKLIQHMYDFFETEFTRDVGQGSEHLYRTGIGIAGMFFNYPNQDAWCYRSCVDRNKFNCAFMHGRAKPSLKLIGAMICASEYALLGNICPKQIIDFSHSSGTATFHHIGSERQIELFPEISTIPQP